MKFTKTLAATAAILALIVSTAAPAFALNINISGNGNNSFNKVKINKSFKKSFSQNNFSSISNSVNINTNTGKNKANKNTGGNTSIFSGSSHSFVSIINQGNHNHAEIGCCDEHDNCPNPTPTPTPSPSPTPTPGPCEPEAVWADMVEDSDQGTLKTGDPITDASRTNPNNSLGSPDGNFFSLGDGGWLTIEFTTPVNNVDGDDLSFHEVTNGRDSYPEERAQVEVSADGSTWFNLGEISNQSGGDGVAYLDFDSTGLDQVSFVRLTDATDFSIHNDEADGYDVDAIDAVRLTCEPQVAQN